VHCIKIALLNHIKGTELNISHATAFKNGGENVLANARLCVGLGLCPFLCPEKNYYVVRKQEQGSCIVRLTGIYDPEM